MAVGAVALWVRSILRRHWGATVALAVLAGLPAGIVGASFQAARRADGSVERHAARSRAYDAAVFSCPPDVGDPSELELFQERCTPNAVNRRFATEVLATMPDVESWTTVGTLVAGVLDASSANGWGRLVLVSAVGSNDPGGLVSRQILVAGRFANESAPDEMVIGEQAARAGGIAAGDTIRLASWHQADIDAAVDGRLAPRTAPFESRVVGIVRLLSDVQSSSEGDLSGATLPDAIYAGPAWTAAHARDFAAYGFGTAVRLRDGPGGADAFQRALEKARGGWFVDFSTENDSDVSSLRRVIQAEGQALIIFALIALIAALAFAGLTLARQLRRELADRSALSALGLTRPGLVAGAAVRALIAAAGATAAAVVTIVAMSPLGPVGIARRLEYSHPVRFDWLVLAFVVVALPAFFAAAAAVTVGVVGRARRPPVGSRLASSAAPPGPVSRVALSFASGGSPRLAVGIGAVAVAGAVAAGTLVASFDRVLGEPVRYGAWWDVAVGQYSDADALGDGVKRITANPALAEAAGFVEDPGIAVLDGVGVPFLSLVPVLGRPETVMASGRAPVATGEVALGAVTARRLHKGIGDSITLTSTLTSLKQTVRVTGIAVLNNPVRSHTNAGEGVVVSSGLSARLTPFGAVAQSIAIRFTPAADRRAAIESVVRDFPGSTRAASPPADLADLERLRFVPWLISVLVGALALASLVHALVTLLGRHARDLAVLAALGLTRRQRRAVGPAVSVVLVGASIAVGVPAGLMLGRWTWRVIGRRISVPSGPVLSWPPIVTAPAGALVLATSVAFLASRWATRRPPAVELRTE